MKHQFPLCFGPEYLYNRTDPVRGSMLAKISYPFLVLALVGFTAMLVVHVAALFGATHLFNHSLMRFAFPGLVIVWLATIVVMNRLCRDFKQKDIWRAALRGCPVWMRYALWAIFGYAWVGMFAFPKIYGGGMDAPANSARAVSGILLAFYSVAFATLYSATRAEKFDEGRRCINGHRMPPLAKYCEECGAPSQTASSVSSNP